MFRWENRGVNASFPFIVGGNLAFGWMRRQRRIQVSLPEARSLSAHTYGMDKMPESTFLAAFSKQAAHHRRYRGMGKPIGQGIVASTSGA